MFLSPVLQGLANGVRGEIAANHLVFRDTSQCVRHALLANLFRFIYRLAHYHLGGHGRTGNRYSAARAFEAHFSNHVILNAHGDEHCVAVHGTAKNGLGRGVRNPACIARIGVMIFNSVAVQAFPALLTRHRTKQYDTLCSMSSDLYSKAADLASQRQAFAIATVVRVQGSSSAKRGSKALISQEGKILLGWVGGGCAESAVRTEALKCIQEERPELITLDLQDELLGVGMPCGGVMDVYIEPVVPRPELLVVGNGRIAETLAELGHLMNFSVIVSDPAATRESFPHAERIIDQDFDLTETPIDARTHVVIATLHKNDHLWLQKALKGEAAYVALIASRQRSRLVLDYLRLEGLTQEKIDRVWAPAGLDLGAATPEEIALSIVSHIVALRRGGSMTPLMLESLPTSAESTAPADKAVIRKCDI